MIGRERLLVYCDQQRNRLAWKVPNVLQQIAHRGGTTVASVYLLPPMVWTTENLLGVLSVVAATMLIVVLYHALFVMVDLRKILRRIEGITHELESVLLKPLAMTDKILSWIMQQLEEHSGGKKKHKKTIEM